MHLIPYPGSKARMSKWIVPLFADADAVLSPFMGSGAVEIALAQQGKRVVGGDLYADLAFLWQTVLAQPDAVADAVAAYGTERSRVLYGDIERNCRYWAPVARAAGIAILHLWSWAGARKGMLSVKSSTNPKALQHCDGWMSIYPKAMRAIGRLPITVEHRDCWASLDAESNMPAYLDPPYIGTENLYRAGAGFDHMRLCRLLLQRDAHWVLSYYDHPALRSMYADCYWRDDFGLKRALGAPTAAKEVLISNRPLTP